MNIKANVSLKGMKKEINREIKFSDQLTMQLFCEYVILSMNGNCKHMYQLIYNDEYGYLGPDCKLQDCEIEELMEEKKVEYLELRPRDKLMLNYDFANDWEFDIKIISVTDEQYSKDFEVISGCGYGIIDDCGGAYRLNQIFNGENTDWGEYNINDFDLNEINRIIDVNF